METLTVKCAKDFAGFSSDGGVVSAELCYVKSVALNSELPACD